MTTNSPVGGAQGRVPLVTSLLVLAVLFAQLVVGLAVSLVAFAGSLQQLISPLAGSIGSLLGAYLPFAVGVFIALRYIAPIGATDGWRRVLRNGVIAAAIGIALFFVVIFLERLAPTVVPPQGGLFGYGGPVSIQAGDAGFALSQALTSSVVNFVDWLPLVLLAAGAQRIWLATHPASPAKGRASASGTP
jgi:hypothetical protein